jgi:hypothetical protein
MNKRDAFVLVLALAAVFTGGVVSLAAQTNPVRQIGPNTATPAYIVVNTPTPVTFTSVIADSNLRKHDPKRVLLLRTDASGTPIDIVGRMRDNGKSSDPNRNDHSYTVQSTLNEPVVATVQFRVAAKFKPLALGKDADGDDDWDGDLGALIRIKDKNQRRDQLTRLLRRLDRYTLSDPVQVTVDPFKLPPDPGDAGKQTLQGIDVDLDGVRDDVQRFIALREASSEPATLALFQFARSLQAPFTIETSPLEAVRQQVFATRCSAYVLGAKASYMETNMVLSRMLNTPSRLREYARIQDSVIAGQIPPTHQSELKSFCSF